MVQPGSGSGKVPITISSVQFSFFEGKQARYMKPRSAASARRAISALFVANGFSVYGRRTFSVFKQNYQLSNAQRKLGETREGVGAAIAAAASVGFGISGWPGGGGICLRGARLAHGPGAGCRGGVVIFFAARTVMAETA
jgi:hypothetical protein